MKSRVLIACVSIALLAPALTRMARADDPVGEAIDKGIAWLLKEIESRPEPEKHGMGAIALETYALVVAGVSVDHPRVAANFERMQRHAANRDGLNHTYTTSCMIFALDAAMSQIEADEHFYAGRPVPAPRSTSTYRALLEKAVKALAKAHVKDRGAWDYGPKGEKFDHSNTQFAVLALGAGAKRNIEIPPEVWELIAKNFVEKQEAKGPEVKERVEMVPADQRGEGKNKEIELVDRRERDERGGNAQRSTGKKDEAKPRTVVVEPVPEVGQFGEEQYEVFARGWNYARDGHGGNATWNMTCAGQSSMILAAQNLRGKVPLEFQNKINRSLRDGYGWIMKHWRVQKEGRWGFYGVYSLEKVGDLGEIRKFADHDWYAEVSRLVVGDQRDDGRWLGEESDRIETSFALLVLNRATSLLTQQRTNRMVVTGPGAEKNESNKDDWVYVEDLDREFHLPSLFRMLRLRPNPRLARYVNLIVDAYPLETNGHLVPGLIQAFDELTDPRFKKLLIDKLEQLTGVRYEEPRKYHVWYRRWKDVQEIGRLVKREETDWLLQVYETTDASLPLRKKIIWALMRVQASKAAPKLIADLSHDDETVREAAYIALTTIPIAGGLPRFDAKAKTSERQEQIAAIEAWFKRVGGG